MNKLYCIGDSHVSVFLGKDKLAEFAPVKNTSLFEIFEVIRLEGILAYNLCEYDRTTKGREKLEAQLLSIPKGSYIIISAGEIDVRVHLLKQAQIQNKSFNEIADILSNRFISYLKTLNLNHKIIILLPPPSSYLGEKKDDPSYPRYGTEVARNEMTKQLNKSLLKLCKANDILCIGVFDEGVCNGYTQKEILWDGIHLSTQALPSLIKQINLLTDLRIAIPVSWWIREYLRNAKKKLNNIIKIKK